MPKQSNLPPTNKPPTNPNKAQRTVRFADQDDGGFGGAQQAQQPTPQMPQQNHV